MKEKITGYGKKIRKVIFHSAVSDLLNSHEFLCFQENQILLNKFPSDLLHFRVFHFLEKIGNFL